MKNTNIEQPQRPIIVMKSGQRMCINPHCRRVFTPVKFDQSHCSETCKHDAPKSRTARPDKRRSPSARPAVKLFPAMVVLAFLLGSCHPYMTDKSIRQSLETFQSGIDSLHHEQQRIQTAQHDLFVRYREIYKRTTRLDGINLANLSASDSLDIATQLLMCDVSIHEIANSMETMSAIYNELWHEINNMYVSIDELEYYCEQRGIDADKPAGSSWLTDASGFKKIMICIGIAAMLMFVIVGRDYYKLLSSIKQFKNRKNGK